MPQGAKRTREDRPILGVGGGEPGKEDVSKLLPPTFQNHFQLWIGVSTILIDGDMKLVASGVSYKSLKSR
jgi:hypothetical protein